MPIEQAQTITVTCDNPSCPGHSDLDAHDLTGWLVISSEVYGETTMLRQVVFGDANCLASFSTALAADELTWPTSEHAPPPPPDAEPSAE